MRLLLTIIVLKNSKSQIQTADISIPSSISSRHFHQVNNLSFVQQNPFHSLRNYYHFNPISTAFLFCLNCLDSQLASICAHWHPWSCTFIFPALLSFFSFYKLSLQHESHFWILSISNFSHLDIFQWNQIILVPMTSLITQCKAIFPLVFLKMRPHNHFLTSRTIWMESSIPMSLQFAPGVSYHHIQRIKDPVRPHGIFLD